LRAGLLSDPEVIAQLNQRFVCTSIIIDDLEKRAAGGDVLAKTMVGQWEYPVEMMFLTRDGKLVSRLNSFQDFPGIHADVSAPPGKRYQAASGERTHAEVFLNRITRDFDEK
jgi:hypothetical protein